MTSVTATVSSTHQKPSEIFDRAHSPRGTSVPASSPEPMTTAR